MMQFNGVTMQNKKILTNLEICKRCKEIDNDTIPVTGEGSQLATICILGRNPGKEEALVGQPFVGRAGRKLKAVCAFYKIAYEQLYITNVVKCLTVDSVPPSRYCLLTCSRTWLDRELSTLLNLKLIIVLGNQALKYFEPIGTVNQLHGTSFNSSPLWYTGNLKLFVSYHPSAALRNHTVNKHFFNDFKKLKELIDAEGFISTSSL